MKKSIIILLCLCHSFSVAQTVKLKLIETSDVHGAIFPYNLTYDRQTNTSLASVMTYLNEQRADTSQHIILLDNGDILQGDPVVYYYNFEKTDTVHLYADVMNYMNYDAATIGNHDIETGHNVYDKFNDELEFPWLAANAVKDENGLPYFIPYTILERGGIKIAVLGLITPAIPQWLPIKIWEGMHFEDMIETARKWMPVIKKENPDLIIGLFHSGIDYTYNDQNAETYKNENAALLVAEQVEGFDVVFVGHDHEGWNFVTTNNTGEEVLILGTQSGARTVAAADIILSFDPELQKWEKVSSSGEIIEVKNYKPDEKFIQKFSACFNEVSRYVSKPVGYFQSPVSSSDALFGPSSFMHLIHTFQLEQTNAEISFASPLSFNAVIERGQVYVRDLFKLYRYENFLYTMILSGKEIDDYLEFSYSGWFNTMKDENDHLLKFKLNESGELVYSERSKTPELEQRYYNFSSAEGIIYTVDVSKNPGERVDIKSMSDGSDFSTEKKYKVAVNSYRGNGGGGHLTRGAGIDQETLQNRIISSTDKDIRFYMMKWIEQNKSVNPQIQTNWKVIPYDWWLKGKIKDYKLLFAESQN
ncbi:MAG: bifunctional metallophosphatase/5'-nucleotidase [Ignavibacteriaceae bacterium]